MTVQRLLELVWLFIPAYCANMAPPFVKYWRGWNRPINRNWLGDHKTVVGFSMGVLVGTLTAFIQAQEKFLAPMWRPELWLAVGFSQGAGAMCGDSLKSVFKRRAGIAPGESWIPADQLDFVIGAIIPMLFIVPIRITEVFVVLVFTFFTDILINHVSFF